MYQDGLMESPEKEVHIKVILVGHQMIHGF